MSSSVARALSHEDRERLRLELAQDPETWGELAQRAVEAGRAEYEAAVR